MSNKIIEEKKRIEDLDKALEELDMKYEQPKVTKKKGRH